MKFFWEAAKKNNYLLNDSAIKRGVGVSIMEKIPFFKICCHLLLLSERRNYASKELLKFFLMASLKLSNVRMNPVATALDKPLFYAFRPLRSLLSKVRLSRMYSIDLITTK